MINFFYYQGDWVIGKKLIAVIAEETLTLSDKKFKDKTGIDPLTNKGITVTLDVLNLKASLSE
jgi:hypothetical protein